MGREGEDSWTQMKLGEITGSLRRDAARDPRSFGSGNAGATRKLCLPPRPSMS